MVKIEGGLSSPPSLYLRLLRHPSLGLGIPRNDTSHYVVARHTPLCHCEERDSSFYSEQAPQSPG